MHYRVSQNWCLCLFKCLCEWAVFMEWMTFVFNSDHKQVTLLKVTCLSVWIPSCILFFPILVWSFSSCLEAVPSSQFSLRVSLAHGIIIAFKKTSFHTLDMMVRVSQCRWDPTLNNHLASLDQKPAPHLSSFIVFVFSSCDRACLNGWSEADEKVSLCN